MAIGCQCARVCVAPSCCFAPCFVRGHYTQNQRSPSCFLFLFSEFCIFVENLLNKVVVLVPRSRPLAYPYPVRDCHIKISDDLYRLLFDAASRLVVTWQDYLCYSLIRGVLLDGADPVMVHDLPENSASYMPLTVDYVSNVGVDVPL